MDPRKIDPLRLHIRKRPGMYVGGANAFGIRNMIDDIVTEQLDAPDASPERVQCTLGSDGEYVLEVAGGNIAAVEPADFDADAGRFASSPISGYYSLAIASALSERLEVTAVRDGSRWTQSFAAGVSVDRLDVTPTDDPPLLRVRYVPDRTLFPEVKDGVFLPLCGRAQEWAAFHPYVQFTIEDARSGQRRDYHYPEGLLSLAKEIEHHLIGSTFGDVAAWRCHATAEDGTAAEAVLISRPTDAAIVYSFVNGSRTLAGGSHVDGLHSGAATVAERRSDANDPSNPFHYAGHRKKDDPLAGLTVLLAVRIAEPKYAYSTKDGLADDRATTLVHHMIATRRWKRLD